VGVAMAGTHAWGLTELATLDETLETILDETLDLELRLELLDDLDELDMLATLDRILDETLDLELRLELPDDFDEAELDTVPVELEKVLDDVLATILEDLLDTDPRLEPIEWLELLELIECDELELDGIELELKDINELLDPRLEAEPGVELAVETTELDVMLETELTGVLLTDELDAGWLEFKDALLKFTITETLEPWELLAAADESVALDDERVGVEEIDVEEAEDGRTSPF